MSLQMPIIDITAFAEYVLKEDDKQLSKDIHLTHVGRTTEHPILKRVVVVAFNKEYVGEANTVFNAVKRALEDYKTDFWKALTNFNKVLEKFEENDE